MISAGSRSETSEFVYSSLRGEPDFVELLEYFVDEIPFKHESLLNLGRSSEFDELKRESHKLRGSAGGFGFQGLSDLAGRLEDSCKNHDRDANTILRNLDELLEYLGKIRK